MRDIAIIILIILVGLCLFILMYRWLMRRAISQVVDIFRKTGATSPQKAKTIEELKLRPQGFFEGKSIIRDFKPYAVTVLIKYEVLLATDDGKFYLVEDNIKSIQ